MNDYGYVTTDMNYVLNEPEREKGVGVYRFLGVLFFLLAVGGLFVGMLGKFAEAFTHSAFIIGMPDGVFDYSLCGAIVNLFRNFSVVMDTLKAAFDPSSPTISAGIWLIFDLALLVMIAIAAVLSLVLMIVAIVSKKKKTACRAASASGILTLIAYGGLFLYSFILSALEAEKMSSALIDTPLAIITGVTFLFLAGTVICRNKGQGALNVITLLLVTIAVCAVAYPGTALAVYNAVAFDLKDASMFLGIAFPILFVLLTLNLILSCARLGSKRGLGVDIARYALLFLATLLTLIAFIAAPAEGDDRWMIFHSPQLLPTVVLIVATLIPLLVSIFATAISTVKRRNEELQQQAMQNAIGPEQYDAPPTNVVVTLDANMLAGRNSKPDSEETDEPVAPPPPPPAPIRPEPAPINLLTPEPAPEPEDVTLHLPESVYTSPEPVVVKEVIREIIREPEEKHTEPKEEPKEVREPVDSYKRKKEMSEFEIRMAAIARGEAPAPKPAEQKEAPARKTISGDRNRNNADPAANGYTYGGQYTYDPFMNTLTPSEKNEFGDVFIANMYGIHAYLPTYVIGGDNREFFQKVFIYLGRYRGFITQELMEKIYAYVNKAN